MFAFYEPEWESLVSRMVGRWCPSFTGNTGLSLPDTLGRNSAVLNNFADNANAAYIATRDPSGIGRRNTLALDFDAVNDFVEFPVINVIDNGDFAFSFWYFPKSVSGLATIFNNWSATITAQGFFCFRNGTQIVFQQPSSSNRVTTNIGSLTVETWHHVVCVKTSSVGGLRVWINGVLDGNAATPGTNQASTARFNLGGNYGGVGPFNAAIDDFCIFSNATASDIQFIYQQGRAGGMLYQPPRRRVYFLPTATPSRRKSSRVLCYPG